MMRIRFFGSHPWAESDDGGFVLWEEVEPLINREKELILEIEELRQEVTNLTVEANPDLTGMGWAEVGTRGAELVKEVENA